jgi:osmotically-inducible protein OsmY
MRTDENIKEDVEYELKWDPDIDSSDIGVAVKDGVVTLSGFARSWRQKRKAEEDATRVHGVKGIANDVEVRLPLINKRPDPEIVREIIAQLKAELPYSADNIKAVVRDGYVTLKGEVEWDYQRGRHGAAGERRNGPDERDRDQAEGQARGPQAQDRGRVQAQRGSRRTAHHGRG